MVPDGEHRSSSSFGVLYQEKSQPKVLFAGFAWKQFSANVKNVFQLQRKNASKLF